MKKAIAVVLMTLLLTGCSAQEENLERIMGLRADLLGGTESSFDAVITADYGDEVHTFSMNCRGNNQGDLLLGLLRGRGHRPEGWGQER